MKEKAASRASAMRWPGGVTPARGRDGCAVQSHSASRSSASRSTRSAIEARGLRDQIGQTRLFFGLDQAEMSLRHRDRRVPRQGAEHGNADALHARAARDPHDAGLRPIEHDARDAHAGAEIPQARGHGRRRLRLPRRVEHQQHRPAHHRRRSRRWRRCRSAPGVATPSNRPIDPSARTRSASAPRAASAWIVSRGHRPAVEIDRGAPGGGGVKRRIDIVGPALEALHRQAAVAIGARQRQASASSCRRRRPARR